MKKKRRKKRKNKNKRREEKTKKNKRRKMRREEKKKKMMMTTTTMMMMMIGRAMAQAVSPRPLTAEALVRSRVSPCGICGRQSGTGTGFSRSTPFPPVSVIPSMPHTPSFVYYRRCIVLATEHIDKHTT